MNSTLGRAAFHVSSDRNRQPLVLDVDLENGQRIALMYSHLVEVHYTSQPSVQICFTSRIVRIEGKNLEQIYDALLERAVKSLCINPNGDDRYPDKGAVITKIEIASPE